MLISDYRQSPRSSLERDCLAQILSLILVSVSPRNMRLELDPDMHCYRGVKSVLHVQ